MPKIQRLLAQRILATAASLLMGAAAAWGGGLPANHQGSGETGSLRLRTEACYAAAACTARSGLGARRLAGASPRANADAARLASWLQRISAFDDSARYELAEADRLTDRLSDPLAALRPAGGRPAGRAPARASPPPSRSRRSLPLRDIPLRR